MACSPKVTSGSSQSLTEHTGTALQGSTAQGLLPARCHMAKPLWEENCVHVCKGTTTNARKKKKSWQSTCVSSTGEQIPGVRSEKTQRPKLKHFRGTSFLCSKVQAVTIGKEEN